MAIAFFWQPVMQRPQPVQSAGSIFALPSIMAMASWVQAFRQRAQPLQYFSATCGATVECWTSFPARLEHPMPRFFRTPPKPVSSWHLKWETATRASASTISAPMETVGSSSAVNFHVNRRMPPQAVAHDERSADDGKGKAVFNGVDQGGHPFFPFSGVES